MKTKKMISLILAAAMLLALFAGCSGEKAPEVSEPETSSEPESTAITLVDMEGTEVSLDKPAEKIVVLSAGECEILYALGVGDKIIGRGEYCDYPAEAIDIPAVQSGYETNVEQIISLAPDAVFTASMDQSNELLDQIRNAGIAVIESNADTIQGTYDSIEMIGKATGKDAEATALVESMKASFADLKEKISGDGTKTVYFEVSPLAYGLWTAGNNTFMNEIAEMVGVKNCFADVEGWAEISEEQVLERNPDYIVTISMYYGEGPTPAEEIAGRTGWQNVNAVKNGAILNLQDNELTRPAPRLVDGAKMLSDLIYG